METYMEEFRLAAAVMGSDMDKLPVQQDKIIFAEDVVNYINDFYAVGYLLDVAGRHRGIAYNAFNQTVKTGINYIQSEYQLPSNIDEISTWDENTYFNLAAEMKQNQLKGGLEPVNFLYFCVNVTVLAIEFLRKGLSHAPKLAAIVIYVTLRSYDMLSGGWDSLNTAARQLKEAIDLEDDAMMDTSSDTSGEDTSDNEPRQGTSRNSSSSDTIMTDAKLLNADNGGNISSDGSCDEFNLHAAVSENSSAFNTGRCGEWEFLKIPAKQLKEANDLEDDAMIDTSREDTSDNEQFQWTSRSSSSSDTIIYDVELLNADNGDNISSDGSPDEFKFHAAVSENSSAFNTERCGGDIQLPNVTSASEVGLIEPIHNFMSCDARGRGETVTQLDVEGNLNVNEKFEDENLRDPIAIANGRPSQHAYENQRVEKGVGSSRNGDTHGAYMYEIPPQRVGESVWFEFCRMPASESVENGMNGNNF